MTMTPYYERDGITIYHGDCRDILPELATGSADLVLTDPPYGVRVADWDTEVPYEILPELLRVGAGPVLWFGSATRVHDDITRFPVRPDRLLVWTPSFSLSPALSGGMYYRWHMIYTWRLPKSHDGPSRDVLTDPTEAGAWWHHPGTKPLSLIRRLIGFAKPAGLVIDPYMGSGTTLRAAMDTGRRAIGIEIEERYCEIAARRLEQQVLPIGRTI